MITNGEIVLPKITEDQFRAFVRVRDSGLTNMWDAGNVESLSGGVVTQDVHIAIINSFDDLAKRFPRLACIGDRWGRINARTGQCRVCEGLGCACGGEK